jgi:hypothetical protein
MLSVAHQWALETREYFPAINISCLTALIYATAGCSLLLFRLNHSCMRSK